MSFRYPAGLITAGSPVAPQFPSGVWTNQQTTPYINGQVWANDPYFQNTTLLLHGDGANGTNNAQLSAFVDNSTNNFPITVNGDAYADNFSPFSVEEGYWSNYFDGSGDSLTVTYNASMAPGSNDFTIEGWYYITETGTTELPFFIIGSNTYYPIGLSFLDSSGYKVQVNASYNGSSWAFNRTGNITVSKNTWVHVALVRNNTALDVYVNGVKDTSASGAVSGSLASDTGGISIGAYRVGGTAEYNGYISNTRYVNGTAVYTSAFTPSTTPLTAITNTSLLTCQSNRFKDNSSNNFAITRNGDVAVSQFTPFTVTPNTTDGSGYFDGTGDYLQLGGQSEFAFGTGDFTIEGWFYVNAFTNTYNSLYDSRPASTNGAYVHIAIENNGKIYLFVNSGLVIQSSTGAISTGQWYHFAVARSGTSNKMFINGTQVGSTYTDTVNYLNGANRPVIATTENVGTSVLNGYISNFRVVKGTAVYTSAFTPPSAPLTAVSGTSLLTCQYQGNVNNNGFVDSGPYDFRITRNGNTTQGSFSPFSKPDGRWGNYFGTNGALIFSSNAAYAIGTGNFTVECFANFAEWSGTFQRVFIQGVSGTTNVSLGRESGGTSLNVDINTTNVISYTWTPVIGQWYHLAVVRTGTGSGQVALYIDGVAVATGTSSASVGQNQFIVGGLTWAGGYNIRGYLSNFRYSNIARTITVPTAPYTSDGNTLILTCQTNRFKDNSSNNFTVSPNGSVSVTPFSPLPSTTAYSSSVNGGSGYFDGNQDYLNGGTPTEFAFGTGDFTVECWIYTTSASDSPIYEGRANGGSSDGFTLTAFSSSVIRIFSGSALISSSGTSYLGQWTHIAVCRVSGTTSLYINGVSVGTTTSLGNNATASMLIGAGRYGGNTGITNFFNGAISNFRAIKGTAVYTSNFTPPTAPVTPIANTSLLCNFTAAGVLDNTGFNNLETVGNSRIATNIEKYGTGSMYFDGTGDYLIVASNSPDNALGSGNFTIEFWVYFNSVSGVSVLVDYRPASTSGAYPLIYRNGTSLIYGVNSGDRITASTTFATGTWYHIAIVRLSGSTKMYVNGVNEGSSYSDSTSMLAPTNRPIIGAQGFTLGNEPLNGYIDDLRITKGVARYTTNFTPPIARFPNQ